MKNTRNILAAGLLGLLLCTLAPACNNDKVERHNNMEDGNDRMQPKQNQDSVDKVINDAHGTGAHRDSSQW